MTGSILELIPHVTEVIAEEASTPGITSDDIKWNTVESVKEDRGRFLIVTGTIMVGEDAMRLYGKLPMDVVLECDKSKIREYFESKRKMYHFEKATATQDTMFH